MTITFSNNKRLGEEELQDLFLSVNWDSGNYPDKLVRAMAASHGVFTAWDENVLIGLINVLSDGHMAAYIHYLLVRPEYQSRGIGRHLVKNVARAYANVLHKVLVAYDSEIGFYERCGFSCPEATSPMFMTDLRI